jgi:predicted kinase
MLVGLPGSGKSTLARRLAPQLPAVVLESDALRRRFFHEPSHDKAESRALFRAIHDALATLLTQGISAIVDATNLKESDRCPLEAVARRRGARLICVYVTAPAATIESRLRRREELVARGAPPEAGIEVYRRMLRTMQPPDASECIRVNTSDAAAYEAAVEQIVQTAGQLSVGGQHVDEKRGWRMVAGGQV